MIVFALNSENSFQAALNWINKIPEDYSSVPKILVGNKCDIIDEEDSIVQATESDRNNKIDEYEIQYIKTSALKGENVEAAFTLLGELAMQHRVQHPKPVIIDQETQDKKGFFARCCKNTT